MADRVTDALPPGRLGGERLAVRRAAPTDLESLVALHREFCGADGHPFDADRAASGLAPLLADDHHGVIWLIEPTPDGGACGYAVVTWGWSIEAGGREALLDEIYVTTPGKGLGSLLLTHLIADARRRGMARIFLETESANDEARSWYGRRGFVVERSVWMNLELVDGV